MGFITIVTDDETFDFPVGDSTFTLRRVPDDLARRTFKRHTPRAKPGREPETDFFGVTNDVLEYAITGWSNIKQPVTKEDVPCTAENKLRLPATVKADIMDAIDQGDIGADEKVVTKN